jgi:hypothetical protein
MPKDVNIHLKTTGADQTKEQLEQTAQATKKVGDQVAQTGMQAQTAGGMFDSFLKRFAGPLGLLALLSILQRVTSAVAGFFDTIKQRADEAVSKVQDVRKAFGDIFEALDAYDEKSRRTATSATYGLLQKTATTEAVGFPIIDAYIRNFKRLVDAGQMTQQQYQQGIEAALYYGQLHAGGPATAELIRLMPNLGVRTPQAQGELMRQISALSEVSGMKDEEIISAIGRAAPAIKALGWSPTQALQAIGTIAAGQVGRHVTTSPAAALEALIKPSAEKLAEYDLEKQLAQRPDELLAQLADLYRKGRATRVTPAAKKGEPPTKEEFALDRSAFINMLGDIFGEGAAPELFALFQPPPAAAGYTSALERARGVRGIAATQDAIVKYKQTMEARAAITLASQRRRQHEFTEEQEAAKLVREIGKEYQETVYAVTDPRWNSWRQALLPGNLLEQENAAYVKWLREMPPEERMIEKEQPWALHEKWSRMNWRQRWQALTRIPAELPAPGLPQPEVIPPTPGAGSPATEGAPPPNVPPPGTESPPRSQLFDNRVINYQIFNPVTGMNKQDLGIEPPSLA